jgi:hypothetical protein
VLLRHIELFDDIHQRLRDRMLWRTAIDGCDFVAPPVERGARHVGIRAFVHHIVHLAAEGIQRRDGAALVFGKEAETVVEAGAAGGRLVLAIFVRSHIRNVVVRFSPA